MAICHGFFLWQSVMTRCRGNTMANVPGQWAMALYHGNRPGSVPWQCYEVVPWQGARSLAMAMFHGNGHGNAIARRHGEWLSNGLSNAPGNVKRQSAMAMSWPCARAMCQVMFTVLLVLAPVPATWGLATATLEIIMSWLVRPSSALRVVQGLVLGRSWSTIGLQLVVTSET